MAAVKIDRWRPGWCTASADPGGNITGLELALGGDSTAKQVEVLKEALPDRSRLARG